MTGLPTTERSTDSHPTPSPSLLDLNDGRYQSKKRVLWYAVILCRLSIHWGKWTYVTEDNCRQLKVCGRCGSTVGRTKHQREWRYVIDGDCRQTKVCKRCGETTKHRIEHAWGPEWETGSWWDRKRNHLCDRCGQVETWSANSEF